MKVAAPDGSFMCVRALLDSGSSASFISERMVQALRLGRTRTNVSVSGIGGMSPDMAVKAITDFQISSAIGVGNIMSLRALVVARVVHDLPTTAIPYNKEWSHLTGLPLADPQFNVPGKVDLLLRVDFLQAYFFMAGGEDLQDLLLQIWLGALWKYWNPSYVCSFHHFVSRFNWRGWHITQVLGNRGATQPEVRPHVSEGTNCCSAF